MLIYIFRALDERDIRENYEQLRFNCLITILLNV